MNHCLTWENLSVVCVKELSYLRTVAVNLSLIDDVDYSTILDPFLVWLLVNFYVDFVNTYVVCMSWKVEFELKCTADTGVG